MKKLLTTLAFVLCLVTAFAGDASDFIPIGFSEDGKHYAFAQTGILDGSGFAYANLAVIEVEKNAFVATCGVELEGDEKNPGTPEKAFQKAKADIKLDTYGIKQSGKDLLVHLPTDFSQYKSNLFAFEYRPEGGASGNVAKFEALIETTKTKASPDAGAAGDFGPPLLLKLSLVGREGTDNSTRVLQDDKSLPQTRSYPLSYSVQRVTAYQESLVVVISYTTPGFEGPSVRYLVVTGKFSPPQG